MRLINKKWMVILIVLFLIIAAGSGIYIFTSKYTLSGILKQYGFSKDDILYIETYGDEVFDEEFIFYLLGSDEDLGMMIMKKDKFGTLKVYDNEFVSDLPEITKNRKVDFPEFINILTSIRKENDLREHRTYLTFYNNNKDLNLHKVPENIDVQIFPFKDNITLVIAVDNKGTKIGTKDVLTYLGYDYEN